MDETTDHDLMFEVTLKKKPPFIISDIKFKNSFYKLSSLGQEEMLKLLHTYVVNHRKKRYQEFIEMVRRA